MVRKNILIVGAGAIGRALGMILSENKFNKIAFWDAVPGKVRPARPLDKLLFVADFVFLCVPSFAVRDAVCAVNPYLKKRAVIVCLAKGVEPGTDLTMDLLLKEILPRRQPFALLFGPMLASELANGACGHAVCAGSRSHTPRVAAIFSGTRLRVKKSYDLRGVALCGALKNIYAIGLGILSSIKSGNNTIGAYCAIARMEMRRLVGRLGGRAETVDSPAGFADLIATGFSVDSRNRQIGCALAAGAGKCQGSEGSRAVHSLSRLLKKNSGELPLFSALRDILSDDAAPDKLLLAVCASDD
jgi:glycerol-3-phosphate dehydrogenase (NAD(P)+)